MVGTITAKHLNCFFSYQFAFKTINSGDGYSFAFKTIHSGQDINYIPEINKKVEKNQQHQSNFILFVSCENQFNEKISRKRIIDNQKTQPKKNAN